MNAIAPEALEIQTEARDAPLPQSFEEWLTWDYEGGLTEWVDGEVKIYMSASGTHQNVIEFLAALLRMFVQLTGAGTVRTAPYAMRIKPGGNAREPGMLFVSTANLARITNAFLDGPADLVVEVISDSSVLEDRDVKFVEYEQGGVREYWILDPRPNRMRADFYVLDEAGRYQPVPLAPGRIYRSTVVSDFWINIDWMWDEKANPLTALAEIVGADKLIEFLRAQDKAGA